MDDPTEATIPPKATPIATSGAPRPITVRLKPIPVAVASAGLPVSPVATDASDAATVRLRPVSLAPSMTAQIVSSTATTPAQISATVQAAKSKTSRIALDSAIGVATSIPISAADNAAPKTIRLKRPTDLATHGTAAANPIIPQNFKSATSAITPSPVIRSASVTVPVKSATTNIRQTSRIPDSVIPTEAPVSETLDPVAVDSSTVTQKKTLKIRRPNAPGPETVTDESSEGGDSIDGITLTPISEIEGAPISKGYKVFSVIAIVFASAAAILLIALNWCLAADAVAPLATKNTVASIPIGVDVSWPGKFVQ